MICPDCPIFCQAPAPSHGKGHLQFAAGTLVFSENQPSLGVYCVRKGLVLVGKTYGTSQAQHIPVAFASIGDLLGATSVSTGRYLNTAEAITDVEICLVQRSDLINGENGNLNPAFRLQLMQQMMQELAMAEAKLGENPAQETTLRLWNLLQSLADHLGVDPDGFIPTDLQATTLARWVGCSTKSLLRSINRLVQENTLKQAASGHRFSVMKRPPLFTNLP